MRHEHDDHPGPFYEPVPVAKAFQVKHEVKAHGVTYYEDTKVHGLQVDDLGLHGDERGFHVTLLEGDHAGCRLGSPFKALAPAYRFLRDAARVMKSWQSQGWAFTDKDGLTNRAKTTLVEILDEIWEEFYGDS